MPQLQQDEVCATAYSDTLIEVVYPAHMPLYAGRKPSFRANRTIDFFTGPATALPILRGTLSMIRHDGVKCISGDRKTLRIELFDAEAMIGVILGIRQASRDHDLSYRFNRAKPICTVQPVFAA